MKIKLSNVVKRELAEKGEILIKFAADLVTAFVMLLLIVESARLSEEVVSGLTASMHDALMSFVLSACHVVVLGFHAVAFIWVSFKSLRRFLKNLI